MNYPQLNKVFNQFSNFLERNGFEPFISMDNRYFREGEDYKKQIYTQAKKLLSADTWTESQIGTGQIRQHVLNAIEIKENNLLHWQGKHGPQSRVHYNLQQATEDQFAVYERAFYNLFKTENNKQSLNQIAELFGRRYDLVAYLFFIKNNRLYLPIASTKFDKAFGIIGTPFKTSHKCSWSNYKEYLGHIEDVQNFLDEKLDGDVSLLDAHSFLWAIQSKKTTLEEIKTKQITATTLVLKTIQPKAKRNTNATTTTNTGTDFLDLHKKKMDKGNAGELRVLEYEMKQFENQADLLEKISNEPAKNPALGYDIDSVEADGTPKQIEVKACDSNQFFISPNELEKSKTLPNYYIYLVRNAYNEDATIHIIKKPDLENQQYFDLSPTNYLVRFAPSAE